MNKVKVSTIILTLITSIIFGYTLMYFKDNKPEAKEIKEEQNQEIAFSNYLYDVSGSKDYEVTVNAINNKLLLTINNTQYEDNTFNSISAVRVENNGKDSNNIFVLSRNSLYYITDKSFIENEKIEWNKVKITNIDAISTSYDYIQNYEKKCIVVYLKRNNGEIYKSECGNEYKKIN